MTDVATGPAWQGKVTDGARHSLIYPDRLVRPGGRDAAVPDRPDPHKGHAVGPAARRRHANPRPRSGAPRRPRQNPRSQGRADLGLSPRRPAPRRERSTRRDLLFLPRSQGRTPAGTSRRLYHQRLSLASRRWMAERTSEHLNRNRRLANGLQLVNLTFTTRGMINRVPPIMGRVSTV